MLGHLYQHEQLGMRIVCSKRHQFSLKYLKWLHQENLKHQPPSI